jgi:hypothetical protein
MPSKPSESRLAEWYIVSMFALGSACFTLAFFLGSISDPLGLGFVVALTGVSEALAVRLHHDGRVSVSTVGIVVGAVSFGFPGAALVASTSAIAGWVFFSRRDPRKIIFNFGQHSASAFVAAAFASALGERLFDAHALFGIALGSVVGLTIFGCSSVAVSFIMALTTRTSMVATYRENFPWLAPHYAALGAVGGGISVAYETFGVAGLVALSGPLILSRYSMKQVLDQTRDSVLRLEKSNHELQGAYVEISKMSDELRQAYTGTLESLVAALDVRDQETRGHSVRVASHSFQIAQLLGIRDEHELETVYRGALMHDVGKIGVPDSILLKPGKLTEEEWEFMRKHSAMGYRILAQVPYLRPTAKIVLAHHERWDGAGYPRKLKGEDIPLGARIFALCDTYDAIISDRPYRQGQSPEAAFAEILRCAGTQFDPQVVEAFEAVFPDWQGEDRSQKRPPLYLPSWMNSGKGIDRAAS